MYYHGGMCVYRKNEIMIKFMNDWYYHYWAQRTHTYQNSQFFKTRYQHKIQQWDQFTLWRMLNETEYFDYKYKINVGVFKDDGRWNVNYLFKDGEFEGDMVLYHYTIPLYMRDREGIKVDKKGDIPITKDFIDLEKYDYYE